MANGYNGGLCLMYTGTYASKGDLVGQGDATLTHGGAPIEINNKSVGIWRENLDNAISTRSVDIDIEFTISDDASFETLVANAFAGTQGAYCFVITDGTSGYYYEGTFTPVISSETASKNSAAISSVQFQSSGAVTRTAIS